MILQALNEYYERKAQEPDSAIPPYGFAEQKISFCLVLSKAGELVRVVDLRVEQGSKARPRLFTVPAAVIRTSAVVPNFLWDKTSYVLGVTEKEEKGSKPKQGEKREKQFQVSRDTFEAFVGLHSRESDLAKDDGFASLVKFLKTWTPDRFRSLENWEAILDGNCVFRLETDTNYLHERPRLREASRMRYEKAADGQTGLCLVTGCRTQLAALHPKVKGVTKSDTSLVSFNLDAFKSYGKNKGLNAPVSDRAAFGYATALNYLLRKGSHQRIQIGDATTVFWAERSTPAEDLLAVLFEPPAPAGEADESGPLEDPATTALIREVLSAVKAGRPLGDVDPTLDPDVRFYILGLSPNNARLAVRFWNVSTFGQLVERLGRHFRDTDVERQYDSDPTYPKLSRLVLETAPLKKTSKGVERDPARIPPLLAGALARCVLTGGPYPRSLFTAILGRIRADRVINYLRAAILKACLVRNQRKEVSMSLDPDRKDPAYRLGRLFALLEKAQKDATDPAATIRDRYFGAASATPAAVFPQLLRLGQHHITKTKAEFGGYTDKLIAEVVDGIDELPKHLSLENQGLFTLGYYHQRNALFRKSEKE